MIDKAQEILKRVRRIELRARKLATESFAGQYQSGFRGQGLDFDDFREYLTGDEPRFIDWKVTARMGTPYVRRFREERQQALILAVDGSGSMRYASQGQELNKLEYAAEISAVLSYSAGLSGDRCGLLIYGHNPRFYLPPTKGVKQTLRIVREILASEPDEADDPIIAIADHIMSTQTKKTMLFMISDFWQKPDLRALGKLNFRHELIPIRIVDQAELELPDAGRVILRDAESGQAMNLNLSRPEIRRAHALAVQAHRDVWDKDFKKLGLDYLDLKVGEDFMPKLRQLFSRRSKQFNH